MKKPKQGKEVNWRKRGLGRVDGTGLSTEVTFGFRAEGWERGLGKDLGEDYSGGGWQI